MIFDAHCDIWTHVARKRLEGERDIMRNYHLNKFKGRYICCLGRSTL